jgi:hypothetical protein
MAIRTGMSDPMCMGKWPWLRKDTAEPAALRAQADTFQRWVRPFHPVKI